MIFEIDTKEVMSMLNGISENVVKKAVPKAVDRTAEQVQTSMVRDAASLSVVTNKTKRRWKWETYGRIPRSTVISKLFRKGKNFDASKGDRGRKVFIQTAKGVGFARRAPHWNLVIYGHKQWIPTGIPGKGQVRLSKKAYEPGRPTMYLSTVLKAQGLLQKNMENQLKLAVKASNRGKRL